MTRDELIEELKKAPANGEVEILASFDEIFLCDDDECDTETTVKVEQWLRVHSVRTIPGITIEAGR